MASNSVWNLVNYRSGLIRALIKNGYTVIAVAPQDKYTKKLNELGCQFLNISIRSHGMNPVLELFLLLKLWNIMRVHRPDVYLGYTIKPNIYGGVAAKFLNIPVINNISGLGMMFVNYNWKTRLIKTLYRYGISKSFKVFFQNKDDRQIFIDDHIVQINKTDILPGSGVDLSHFSYTPKNNNQTTRFLLIARLLWDKGIQEYIDAASVLRDKYDNLEFCLMGFIDQKNPNAVSKAQIDTWDNKGYIKYLGSSDDVRKEIIKSDCVVLPSYYREGVPRSLLESAAIGRPIITTNSVGCREVVDDEVNGYLCQAGSSRDLTEKMERFLSLTAELRSKMGAKSRQKMEIEFDEQIVVQKYLQSVQETQCIEK